MLGITGETHCDKEASHSVDEIVALQIKISGMLCYVGLPLQVQHKKEYQEEMGKFEVNKPCIACIAYKIAQQCCMQSCTCTQKFIQ